MTGGWRRWLDRILGAGPAASPAEGPILVAGGRRDGRWPAIRAKHLALHPVCAACGQGDCPEVHHIVPVHIDPTRELDENNLITLCGDGCHLIFGHLKSWPSWNRSVVTDCAVYLSQVRHRPR